ncbi:MAG: hypothetical protein QM538_06230, partial [Methylacidiphilales bacterium]|nr:hypothetical protein [Candidatus Methylacidiphilales bacterium]
ATAGLGTSNIYENTLEAITSGTITLSALNGISMSGTFTSGLTLANNVNLSLTTTCTGSVCTGTNDNINISQAITAQGTGTITITSGSALVFHRNISANSVTLSAEGDITRFFSSSIYRVSQYGAIPNGGSFYIAYFSNSRPISVGDLLEVNSTVYTVTSIIIDGGLTQIIFDSQPPSAFSTDYTISSPLSTVTSYSGTIALTSTNGSIGTSAEPIFVAQDSQTGELSATASSGNVFIRSRTSSLSLGAISGATASTNNISIVSTAANADINIRGNISGGNVTLTTTRNISGMNGSISIGTSSTLTLRATNGSIGDSTNSLTISGPSAWTSTNLLLTTAAAGNIYLKSASSGLLNATINTFLAGILSLEQTSGNLSLTSNPLYPSATLILKTTDNTTGNGSIMISSYIMYATNVTLDAYRNITTTTGTISVGSSGTLTLKANNGSIGDNTNSLTIAGPSAWSSSNLLLTTAAAGNIYLKSASSGLLNATINTFSTGTLSLQQTSGNISLSTNLNRPTATVILKASDTTSGNGSISLGTFNINAAFLTLDAYRNITTTTGTISVGSSGILTLKATNGSVADSTNSLTISGPSAWSSSNLLLTTAAAGNIYLKSASIGLLNATINTFSSGILSLEQTSGNLTLSSNINRPTATLILKASDTTSGNGSISLGTFNINAASLTLDAYRNITTTTGAITIVSSGILTLNATNGSIANNTNSLNISGPSAWSSSNLLLTTAAAGNIYIRTSSIFGGATINNFSTGTLSLEQTSGNLSLSTNLNRPTATVILKASDTTSGNGSISLGTFNINAAFLTLDAYRNITTTTGTISVGSSGILTLKATNGSVADSTNSLTISGPSAWSSSNLLLTTAAAGNIYLKSASIGLLNATINTFSSGILSLEQTSGNLTLSSNINRPTATLIFRATDNSATNGSIDFSSFSITANSVTITARIITASSLSTNTYHIRSPALSLMTTSGDIASITNKLVISSAVNETPDFTSLSVNVPLGNIAYLIRLGGVTDKAQSAIDLIKASGTTGVVNIYKTNTDTTPIVATALVKTKQKKAKYEGFISELLYNLVGSLGFSCDKSGLLAETSKLICSLGL